MQAIEEVSGKLAPTPKAAPALPMVGMVLAVFGSALLAALMLRFPWRELLKPQGSFETWALFTNRTVSPPHGRGIRCAYRQFLCAMRQIGLGRKRAESPREYARRLGLEEGTNQLDELTTLYEQVRYGAAGLELESERAEHLAVELPKYFRKISETKEGPG